MPVPRLEKLDVWAQRHGAGSRMWAEWCFARVCFRHFRTRLLLMAMILLVGATMFMVFEPEKKHTLVRSLYYTFSLIFGETPEEFPKSRLLQALFFIVPVLGLTVIIEGIVDFALMVRDRRRYERSWCVMLAASFSEHIVLVGLGRLGFQIFCMLRRMGQPVVVIERDPANEFLEEVRRDGSPLIIGDARREALLEDANIAQATSIVLATDDDMANLEAALDARRINSQVRVVLRMFDQNMADKVRDGFNIHMAMSQSVLSAPTFATCAIAPATINSVVVAGQLVVMQRWLVRTDGPLCGLTVAEVMREHRVTVIELRHTGAASIVCPDPEARLEAGDGLVLQGPLTVLDELRQKSLEEAAGDGNG